MPDDRNSKTGAVPGGAARSGITGVGPAPARPGASIGQNPLRSSGTTGVGFAPTRPGSNIGSTALRSGTTGVGAAPGRDPRASMVVPVRYKYPSFLDFVETQSSNISRSGMFVSCPDPLPIGTIVDFEFGLADGFAILRGKAEVIRLSMQPPTGMGIRFQSLDDASRKLIERIVEVNTREGKKPTVSMDFAADPAELRGLAGATPISGGVQFNGRDLMIQVSTATVGFFIYNPLLNIRLGGFVVPAPVDVPLGTIFGVTITDFSGQMLFSGKGKVVAKHEMRLGIRLTDADKATLNRLQAEIAKLSPAK
jgi:uncharacterized protein (TIGR02266 family)